MSRLNWQRRNMEYLCVRRGTINIGDEEAMLQRSTDRATRYLSKQDRFMQQRTKIIAAQPRKSIGGMFPVERSFADLDPLNPHDQLEGADLTTPPWD